MRWMVGLLCLSLATMPCIQAGTAEAPELTDPAGDTWVFPAAPATGPLADAMDLVAVWLEEAPNTVKFTMQVVNLEGVAAVESNPAGDARWWVEFAVVGADGSMTGDETPWEVQAFVSQGTLWATAFTLRDPQGGDQEVAGGLDLPSNTVWIEVPKSALGLEEGGGRLKDLYSRTGSYFPAYPLWIGDDGTEQEGVTFTVGSPGVRNTVAPGQASDVRESPSAAVALLAVVLTVALLGRRHRID